MDISPIDCVRGAEPVQGTTAEGPRADLAAEMSRRKIEERSGKINCLTY
jgi:hypothetical protein